MSYNILVVDDSHTARALIRRTLSLAQVPVGEFHEATHGAEALSILGDHWVDLVILDINMPVMNGLELIERMAAEELLASVPVVVVSTDGSKPHLERLNARGISAYVRKPFTPEQLRDVVLATLGDRDAE